MEEKKICPFCGSESVSKWSYDTAEQIYQCNSCSKQYSGKACRRCGEILEVRTDRFGNDPFYYCEKCDKKYWLDANKKLLFTALLVLVIFIAVLILIHYLTTPVQAAVTFLILFIAVPVIIILIKRGEKE